MQLGLLSSQFVADLFKVGTQFADEFVLFLHRVAVVGMMRGAADGATDAFAQVASQLDDVLALAQGQGIFLLVTQLAQVLDFVFKVLDVESQVVEVESEAVDVAGLFLYQLVAHANPVPQRLGSQQHLTATVEFGGTFLQRLGALSEILLSVDFEFGLQGLDVCLHALIVGKDATEHVVLLLLVVQFLRLLCGGLSGLDLQFSQILQLQKYSLAVFDQGLMRFHRLALRLLLCGYFRHGGDLCLQFLDFLVQHQSLLIDGRVQLAGVFLVDVQNGTFAQDMAGLDDAVAHANHLACGFLAGVGQWFQLLLSVFVRLLRFLHLTCQFTLALFVVSGLLLEQHHALESALYGLEGFEAFQIFFFVGNDGQLLVQLVQPILVLCQFVLLLVIAFQPFALATHLLQGRLYIAQLRLCQPNHVLRACHLLWTEQRGRYGLAACFGTCQVFHPANHLVGHTLAMMILPPDACTFFGGHGR